MRIRSMLTWFRLPPFVFRAMSVYVRPMLSWDDLLAYQTNLRFRTTASIRLKFNPYA